MKNRIVKAISLRDFAAALLSELQLYTYLKIDDFVVKAKNKQTIFDT